MFRVISKTSRNSHGNISLGRVIAWIGVSALTFGFYKDAIASGVMDWKIYIAYAVSLTIMYAPAKAIDLIRAIKGESISQPQPEPVIFGGTDVKPS